MKNKEIQYLPICEEETEFSELMDEFAYNDLRYILASSIYGDNIKIFKNIVEFSKNHPKTWKKSIKKYNKTLTRIIDENLENEGQ